MLASFFRRTKKSLNFKFKYLALFLFRSDVDKLKDINDKPIR